MSLSHWLRDGEEEARIFLFCTRTANRLGCETLLSLAAVCRCPDWLETTNLECRGTDWPEPYRECISSTEDRDSRATFCDYYCLLKKGKDVWRRYSEHATVSAWVTFLQMSTRCLLLSVIPWRDVWRISKRRFCSRSFCSPSKVISSVPVFSVPHLK